MKSKALNFILDRTLYEHDEDNGTIIIPGHGRLCNEFEGAEYAAYAGHRSRPNPHDDQPECNARTGESPRPTIDYNTRFGADSGSWTTDMFIEAIYTSLKNPPPAPK